MKDTTDFLQVLEKELETELGESDDELLVHAEDLECHPARLCIRMEESFRLFVEDVRIRLNETLHRIVIDRDDEACVSTLVSQFLLLALRNFPPEFKLSTQYPCHYWGEVGRRTGIPKVDLAVLSQREPVCCAF